MSDAKKLTITIDGKECECVKGEYLYDVAARNGIRIPTLCRSDAFEDHRACCRVCIVEVIERGRSKVVTSCVYPVESPIEVLTASEKILEERAVLFALLKSRAPEAEVLDKMSRKLDKTGFDRFIIIDGEKCILYGQCVQACASLGTGAISTVNRGVDKKIDTPYGVESKYCVGCLSCANVCPTGAIEYSQDATTRTIWNRTFELAFCEECGEVMGTREQVAYAAEEAGLEPARVCDACRKKRLADDMMRTYRYV
ncbi:MAG: (2Fe-2S)-binding protein [Eggerthellaceae bacterium]|nr:(2Fe-2S)-binding protein [Eggerthellaceae bacterium]